MCFLAFSHQYYEHNFSFQSHRLLFSHASEEVGGENRPGKKFASIRIKLTTTRSLSPTSSPLSHPGRTKLLSAQASHLDKSNFLIFWYEIKNCHVQTHFIWKSQKFVIWARVHLLPNNKILDR